MKFSVLALILVFICRMSGQTDCGNALVVCGNTNFENLELNGMGQLQEISSCGSEEHNSLWLRINIQQSGTLAFNIVPESTDLQEDFDFFLFTYNSCVDYTQIRCSTTHPPSAGLTTNITGLDDLESDFFEGPSELGSGFVKSVDAVAGETYMLVIDRPSGFSNFSIQWTGTATFNDPPEIVLPPGVLSFDIFKCDADGTPDGITVFDLTQNTPAIIGAQSNIIVTYYASQSDCILGINAIANPEVYANTANPQTIYVRATNAVTECFNMTEFAIGIDSEVTLFTDEYEICDDATDGNAANGQAVFNFNDVAAAVFPDISMPGFSAQFFLTQSDAENNNNQLPANFYNTTPGQQTVYIKIDSDFCDAIQPVDLIVRSIPVRPAGELVQCDYGQNPDGITVFNLSQADAFFVTSGADLTVQYFESAATMAANTPLPDIYTNSSNPQTVFVKITDNVFGCSITNTLTLKVNTVSPQALLPLEKCDLNGSGIAEFNLAESNVVMTAQETAAYYQNLQDALLQQNQIANVASYHNATAFNATVFVRIDDVLNGCSGISELELVVHPLPLVEPSDTAVICAGQPNAQVAIDAGILPSGQSYTYQWTFGNTPLPGAYAISATQPGTYAVDITNANGCTSTRTIQVVPSNLPLIESVTVVNNTATVNLVAENPDFGFSIDLPAGPFQSGNHFGPLPCGPHTAYVDDGAGCNIASFDFDVMIIPTYFSPNGDGVADRWNIECGQNHPAATIDIFDRYGKLLLTIKAAGAGWDGNYNGEPMPSDDYWYVLHDNGKTTKGHFAMKR